MAKDRKADIKIIKELIEESSLRAASSVEGVAEAEDVKTDLDSDNKSVAVKMLIDVIYGFKIPAVSWDVQTAVKNEIKNSTGYDATKIDIHIRGVKKKTDNK